MPSSRVDEAVDRHIVGGIEKGCVDLRVLANDGTKKVEVSPIAAADAVLSEDPNVAGFRARLDGNSWDVLVVGIILALHDHVDLTGREARDGEIKIDVHHSQVGQFQLEDLEVPTGVEGDLVVGQAQGTLLRIREAAKDDGRDLGHPDGLRCE